MTKSFAPRSDNRASAVFLGSESLVTECAIRWLEAGNLIVLLSSPQSDMQKWCSEQGIDFLEPGHLTARCDEIRFDYLFSIVNFQLLSKTLLAKPNIAAINFHDGPLPQYAGRNVTTWALLNGEKKHSVCWHMMAPEVDSGDICEQEAVSIDDQETSFTLNLKCFKAGLSSYERLIEKINSANDLPSEPVTGDKRIYLSKQRPNNACLIDFNETAAEICRLSRALDFGTATNPLGIPKVAHREKWIGVSTVLPVESLVVPPGLVAQVKAPDLIVGTSDHAVALSDFVTPSGDTISASRVLEHFQLNVGKTFDSPGNDVRALARNRLERHSKNEPYWVSTLQNLQSISMPFGLPIESRSGRSIIELPFTCGSNLKIDDFESFWIKAWLAFLARFSGQYDFHICIQFETDSDATELLNNIFQTAPPIFVSIDSQEAFASLQKDLERQLLEGRSNGIFARDLLIRDREAGQRFLESGNVAISLREDSLPEADLCFIINERKNRCSISYDESKLGFDYGKMLVDCFEVFLDKLKQNVPLCQLEIINESQKSTLLNWSGPPSTKFPENKLLHELILEQAKQAPNACAVTFGNTTLSYRELEERSHVLSSEIIKAGSRGSLVGIHLDRSIDLVIAIIATLRSGSPYLPLDPMFPKERLRFMLDDSDTRIVIASRDSGSDLELSGLTVIYTENCNEVSLADTQNAEPFEQSDTAYVMYTSGSTGKPKGVVVPHRSVVNFLISMCSEPGINQNDRFLAVTTTSFDISILEIFGPLIVGACVILADNMTTADGIRLKKLIDDSGATIMQATPATWRMLIQADWTGRRNLKILSGGESLAPDLASELMNRSDQVWNMYGPTETTIWSSCKRLEKGSGPISIGTGIANTKLYILNSELMLQPPGVPGELCIGGAGVASGYLNRPCLTEERFIPDTISGNGADRIYRTGDRGRWLSNGDIEHLGRYDSQVKLRGYRIELGEVEYQLNSRSDIKQSAVNIWTPASGESVLVAYLIGSNNRWPSSVTLRKFLRQKLPDYMVPRFFVTLDAFPLTANGKLDRKALPPPARDMESGPMLPLVTDTEHEIAKIWSNLLQSESIGRDANFFTHGGQSLLAVKAVDMMTEAFSKDIQLKWLVNENLQTIAEFCLQSTNDPHRQGRFSGLGRIVRRITEKTT